MAGKILWVCSEYILFEESMMGRMASAERNGKMVVILWRTRSALASRLDSAYAGSTILMNIP